MAAAAGNPFSTVKATISAVRQHTNRAILFYSCGKDSIALLDMMSPVFDEVVLVFMYLVPGLSHIDRYLDDAQRRYKNVDVIKIPHFRLSSIRREGIFCKPKKVDKILKLSDAANDARAKTGISWVFYGMKKNDGMNRRLMLSGYGTIPINLKTKNAYPLSNLSNADVLSYIRQKRLPFPIRYGKKQSNGVDFNVDCFLWLRQNEPDDLKRIYREFPLSRQILFEYDFKTSKIRDADNFQEGDTERTVQPAPNKRLSKKGSEKEPKNGGSYSAVDLE